MQTTPRNARPTAPPRWGMACLLRSLTGGPGHRGAASDHFDRRHFYNAGAPAGRSLADLLRWRWTAEPKPWPAWVVNRAQPSLPVQLEAGRFAVTFINHVTFLIQVPGINVITDPVYSPRASPFRARGPHRVRDPGIPFERLPKIDLVLVSHNHYDHLDIETLLRLEAKHAPLFVTGLGNRAFLRSFGLRRIDELDWWQSVKGPPEVWMTPAQHWSTRGPGSRNRTLWGGFILRTGALQIFFAGDTGYAGHFKDIRARFGRMDLALLPIGAYEPRWFMRDQHMNPEDAVRAHLDLEARASVGMHFGCFRLTDEGIDDPVVELARARAAHDVSESTFQILETGETRVF